MAGFSFKKAFNSIGKFLEEAFSPDDLPGLSDKFAQSAFKKQGYDVVARESFTDVPKEKFINASEATYLLKKDDKEFVGTVEGYYITPIYHHGMVAHCPRLHNVKQIQPKI